jgi:hypothetical protein
MTEPQVAPNWKDSEGECSCGCGSYGRLMKNGHVARKCQATGKCRSCLGRRNKRYGHRKQAKARKALGVPDAKFLGMMAHEELFGGLIRTEVKAGKSHADPVATHFLASEKQSEQNRAIGDTRPFIAAFMPSKMDDGLVVIRMSQLRETVAALAEQLGLVA